MAWRSKRKVKHAYDVTAQIYDERYSEEQQKKYTKGLENIDVLGAAVLDVGCGSGLFFKQVAPKAQIVVGVDVSIMLLKNAKRQANLFENISVLLADADHLPFKGGAFEVVFGFTMLQNMPKPARTIIEIKRVIKTNGKIIITGLKKAFRVKEFMDILEGSEMNITAFIDEEDVNCYLAILAT